MGRREASTRSAASPLKSESTELAYLACASNHERFGRRRRILRDACNTQAHFLGTSTVDYQDAIVAPPVGIHVEIDFPWAEACLRKSASIRRPIVPTQHPFARVKDKSLSLTRIISYVVRRWSNY